MTEDRFEWCIDAMNRGDRDGLKEVYEEYGSYIYGIVRQLLPSKEEAEDITADFFIKLWEKSGSYKKGHGHKGWMATIARNLAVDHLRKHKREVLLDFQAEREEGESGMPASATGILKDESPDIATQVTAEVSMEEALSTLKEAERQVIHMKIMADMTFQEIADILRIPIGTVSWRYREAIKKLRRCGYAES